MSGLDLAAATAHTERTWEDAILPTLHDYIRIPNVSPAYEPAWAELGEMDRAVALVRDWCAARQVDGLAVEVVQLPGRTPVLLLEVPASSAEAEATPTTLLYGHLDKQPPMTGWRDGLAPWEPVVEGDRLYGRGGADDGYAAFASLAAIEAVRAAGGAHGRCVVLIEASEESGSPDLPAYVDHLADRIGTPGLVICLDSGAGDYERLWVSTSLRGMLHVNLRVDVLTEGVHSGMSSGAADSFRIARLLLDRVEDAATGRIRMPELHVDVPAERERQIAEAAAVLGDGLFAELPLAAGARPAVATPADLLRERTWAPSLTVIDAGGLPDHHAGGNVLRPFTELGLSFRLPPGCDPAVAAAAIEGALTADPPYDVPVTVEIPESSWGWNAPPTAPWLAAVLDTAGAAVFGAPPVGIGIGGTIPFMAMLGARFPDAQFVVTGVLGPGSNAHGPNEFLHIPTGKRLTAVVAAVLDAATRSAG